MKVAIVGGGIGGLAAALAFRAQGAEVALYEQAEAFSEVGAGLQLSPNAMKVLEALEITVPGAFVPQFAAIRDGQTGAQLFHLTLGAAVTARYGAPYLNVHRADLLGALVAAAEARGVALHLGTRCAEAPEADLVIGADGLRSALRTEMLGSESPRFTGQTAWRGTAPAEGLPVEPGATVWAGPGGHVVTYLLRGGSLVNVVAVEERSRWEGESWVEARPVSELAQAFQGWAPEVQAVLAALPEAHLWALYDRPVLPRWHQGNVVLLGDACHPTLPFMAQGAAMALEDALVLAAKVNIHGVPAGLAAYEAARKPRCTKLQQIARRNGRIYHDGRWADRAQLRLAMTLPERLRFLPLDQVYGYDPRMG